MIAFDRVWSHLNPFFWASLMSTQYTTSSCLFHTFSLYQGRRGASKLIASESFCSLFIGSTGVKNTVCLLLKFCPPGINPDFTMECKLIAHPTMINVLEENLPEQRHCPVMKDRWDCVLNDLGELGGTRFLLAFCHSTLQHFIRPMLRSHKFVPKKIFTLQKFNGSIFLR